MYQSIFLIMYNEVRINRQKSVQRNDNCTPYKAGASHHNLVFKTGTISFFQLKKSPIIIWSLACFTSQR